MMNYWGYFLGIFSTLNDIYKLFWKVKGKYWFPWKLKVSFVSNARRRLYFLYFFMFLSKDKSNKYVQNILLEPICNPSFLKKMFIG
jgi:hypothetical protein